MKIFLSFLQSKLQHQIPAYSFWEYYIKNGIEETGYNWVEEKSIDWAFGLTIKTEKELNAWKANVWEKTIFYIKNNPVDLFLSYLYPFQIDNQAILEIQKLGIPCVNFFCDNVREFNTTPKEFAIFDLNWVPEYKALNIYRKANISNIHLPMPMWVDPSLRNISSKISNKITFIGSKDTQRQLLFNDLFSKFPEFNLEIYGSGWLEKGREFELQAENSYTFLDKIKFQYNFIKRNRLLAYIRKIKQRNFNPPINEILLDHLRGKVSFEKYIDLSKNSAITLGINRYPSFQFPIHQPNTYSRLRDIEAPMLGACYLTEWTEGIEEMYDIGKDIEVYRNIEELIEKSKEILRDNEKAKSMRINGQKKALYQHSIKNSLLVIVNNLNIKASC